MATRADLAEDAAAGGWRLLAPRAVAAPWGRHVLGPWGLGLGGVGDAIGEVHHGVPGRADELQLKTLFTAERLSVQVHPDPVAARAHGWPRGKDEAWVVLAAEPGAVIGVGLRAACDAAALRAAALDGSILGMMAWHPCAAGDVFFAPAGTIHAIGAGITLFEVQQNCDVTYRLFDYGRGRALHLDAGLAVARTGPWAPSVVPVMRGRDVLVAGPGFVLERVRGAGVLRPGAGGPVWVAAVTGRSRIDGIEVAAGSVGLAAAPVTIEGSGELLLAYAGDTAIKDLWWKS